MSARPPRLSPWLLGILVATACGRNDILTTPSGQDTDPESSSSTGDSGVDTSADSTGPGSTDITDTEFTATFSSTGPFEDCGNGTVDVGENCDGLDLAGQSCVSQGFSGGTLGCSPDCFFNTQGCVFDSCGDGFIDAGEQCDEFDLGGQSCESLGLGKAGDLRCNPDCTFDIGDCSVVACGNGIAEGDEACDDFDLNGEDCVSQGFDGGFLECELDCTGFDISGCLFSGGDCCAAHAAPGCDDATCEAQVCAVDSFCCDTEWDDICADAASGAGGGFGCLICTCGDGALDGGETCDGAALDGESCISLGFDGGALACTPDCTAFDIGACTVDTCGNGAIEGAETCDGADLAGQSCVSLGFGGGALACTGDCSAFDTTGCVAPPMCGNDMVEGAEACDGADLAGESCPSLGFAGGVLGCAGDCSVFDTSGCLGEVCGNGTIEGVEVCDGLELAGQSCVSLGFGGGALGCAGDCSAFDTTGCMVGPVCGNNAIEGAEVCDGTDLAGLDCISLGFDGGALSCLGDCSSFDTGGCTLAGDSCCMANGNPGCNNASCEADVCALNPFCCIIDWDAMCAAIATGTDGGGNECLVCTCGNGALDGNETCDGIDLDGESCISQGFAGGALGCSGDCGAFDTTGCMP